MSCNKGSFQDNLSRGELSKIDNANFKSRRPTEEKMREDKGFNDKKQKGWDSWHRKIKGKKLRKNNSCYQERGGSSRWRKKLGNRQRSPCAEELTPMFQRKLYWEELIRSLSFRWRPSEAPLRARGIRTSFKNSARSSTNPSPWPISLINKTMRSKRSSRIKARCK